MSMNVGQSLKMVFGLFGNLKKVRSRKSKKAAYDKAFLAMVTDPAFMDGSIHRMYRQGLHDIDTWFRQESSK